MSAPTTPVISITDINDETTVIEQPREESPSPLPIPPPQSMSSLNDDSMSPHHSPVVSSDDEADNDSDTTFSRSCTPSPDSTIATLMQFLADTAEHLAEPIRVVNHTMRNIIVTRDRMIHRLSTATELLNDEQREVLIISLQEFAVEAENLGLPLIPQEIIEGFFERVRPRDASPEVIARDAFALTTPLPKLLHATHSLSLRLDSSQSLSLCKQVKNKLSSTQSTHCRPSLYKLMLIFLTIPIPILLIWNPSYQ